MTGLLDSNGLTLVSDLSENVNITNNVILLYYIEFCKWMINNHDDGEDQLGDHHALFYTQKMREDPDNYNHFYNVFVRGIVGKKEFDMACQKWTETSVEKQIATVSDEALALLCFENHLDVWKDVWEKSEGQIRKITKNEEYPKEWISTKITKYTTKRDSKGMPIDTKDKSWTIAGITRFNDLFGLIHKDCKKHPEFIHNFIEWRKSTQKKVSSVQDLSSKSCFPDAKDSLFHDPDDLNVESFTPVARKHQESDDSDDDEEEFGGQDSSEDESNDGHEEENEDDEVSHRYEKRKGQRKLKMV